MKKIGLAVVILLFVTVTAVYATEELYQPLFKAPLPEDAVIQPASPEVPAEYARFLGVWEGNWNWRSLPNRLIVMSIKNASDGEYEAEIYFGAGEEYGADIVKHTRLVGTFVDESLFFVGEKSGGIKYEVRFEPKKNPSKLDGYYTQNGGKGYSTTTVKKVR